MAEATGFLGFCSMYLYPRNEHRLGRNVSRLLLIIEYIRKEISLLFGHIVTMRFLYSESVRT